MRVILGEQSQEYTAIEKLKFCESFIKLHLAMDNFSAFCRSAGK